MRHNELHDFIASLLSEVCHNVCVEPPLQPLTGETLPLTVQDWMWLQMVFRVAVIRGSLLMLKCLVLMLPLTRFPACLHCIVNLRKKSRGNMSNAFVKWRWDVLLCWYFPLSGEYLLSVTFFSRDLPPCLPTRGTFPMMW